MQTSSLLGWDGDPNHNKGFKILCKRLNHLLPPVPVLVGNLIWNQRSTIVLSLIAGIAFYLLDQQRKSIGEQLTGQTKIAADLRLQLGRDSVAKAEQRQLLQLQISQNKHLTNSVKSQALTLAEQME